MGKVIGLTFADEKKAAAAKKEGDQAADEKKAAAAKKEGGK